MLLLYGTGLVYVIFNREGFYRIKLFGSNRTDRLGGTERTAITFQEQLIKAVPDNAVVEKF